MEEYGYAIQKVLVTSIDPAQEVVNSMNAINAAQRDKVAAEEEGEADRIRKVKAAQAEAESKKLQGEGIAEQRKAIARGIKESTEMLRDSLGEEVPESAIMNMMLLTQAFDVQEAIGKSPNTKILFMPSGAGALAQEKGILDQLLMAEEAANGNAAASRNGSTSVQSADSAS
jgi:regulator of protease activity HflC (stomatin/prohibitin superfamily)